MKLSSVTVLISLLSPLFAGCSQAQTTPAGTGQPAGVARLQVPVEPAPFTQTVWRAGKSGTLHLTGLLHNYQGAISVSDYGGRLVWSGTAAAGVETVTIPIASVGFYTLKAGPHRFNFSIVPNPVPQENQTPNRFLIGLNTHFAQRDAPEEAYKILQAIEIDAVRDEMGWTPIEKEKGVYTFPERHLHYNAMLKKHGIPLNWSASYGNALYPQVGNRYPAAEAAEPYARYVVEVLKKFGDNIIAVEILNEPNKVPPVKDYLPVLQATHQAVKRAGFQQPIISIGGAGPAGGGMAPQYARTVFGAGGAKYTDGFSQHPYMTPFPPDTGYSPPNGVANLDAALTRAGDVVQKFNLQGSWITELGWPGIEEGQTPTAEQWDDNRSARAMVSEPKQAAFTARMVLISSKFPHLKGLYVYDFQDDGPIALRREHRFGLVRQDLQPKIGFQAFAIATHFLRDKTFVRTIEEPDSLLRGQVFRDKKGEFWLAAWTTEVTMANVNDVIERKQTDPKAGLPRRHMENEYHARFTLESGTAVTGYDWQGVPLVRASEWTATSLPMYLHLGREDSPKGWKLLETKQIKIGSLGAAENANNAVDNMNGADPVVQQ